MTDTFTIKGLEWVTDEVTEFQSSRCDKYFIYDDYPANESFTPIIAAFGSGEISRHSGIKEAKAACEAHHKARIMEHLEPVPSNRRVDDEWQDIETAPKDGTWIYGYSKRRGIEDCFQVWAWSAFNSLEDLWVNASDDNDYDEQPTHWQPLPTPPGDK